MADLDEAVKKLNSLKLEKSKANNYSHHMFTPYFQKSTNQYHFFRLIHMPAHLHISEGISEVAKKKYGETLLDLEIIVSDRVFQNMSYLVIAKQNIINLENLYQARRSCTDSFGQHFFTNLIRFLLNLHQLSVTQRLPDVIPSQVGVRDNKTFCLCDPSLYFKSEDDLKLRQKRPKNSNHFLTEFLKKLCKIQKVQDKKDEDQLKELFGDMNQNKYNLLIKILHGELTIYQIEKEIESVQSQVDDDTTTISNPSFIDNQSQGSSKISFGQNGSSSSVYLQKIKKMNPLAKIAIIFILIGMFVVAGYFIFTFFTRPIICDQGTFLADKNQCLPCREGCLRCINQGEDMCKQCTPAMFLVLNSEKDEVGSCQRECSGYMIRNHACLRPQK